MRTLEGRQGRVVVNIRDQNIAWYCIFISWLFATVSMLGAMFFSEVMGVQPCVLC